MSEELAVVDQAPLVPMSMGTTFHAYKSMQGEIDKAMPDQIMSIQGRQFRKKGYWRAVRAAFGLKVWCVSEERIEAGGDWGYSVLYRAEAKNGMSADGDGVCMASEKAERQRSVHNVRSHAHTRAFNRAVSNLVGFGEVSAEEVEHEVSVAPAPAPKPVTKPAPSVAPDDTIPFDEPQEDNTPIPPPAHAVYVKELTHREAVYKAGPKQGEKYTQYFITMTDGAKGSFFDGQLAVTVQAALAAKALVVPTWEQKGQYRNLVSLLRAD